MAALPIVTGATTPILRAKTKKVPQVTKAVQKLVKDMKDTVKKAEGLGIAAPQVNRSERICLARLGTKMTVLINPEIIQRSAETELMTEACLSLPNIEVDVPRATRITLRYTDEDGNETEKILDDLDARVVQHEIDHLDGVLIVDYRS